MEDKLFSEKRDQITDFNFGEDTAAVFDDMLLRSVPYYAEIQRMIAEMAAGFATHGSNVYDLGCSTCNTFLELDPHLPQGASFVGIDFSEEMLHKAESKLKASRMARGYKLVCADLNDGVAIENASVVIMNLTLQFIRPMNRSQVITAIANGTKPGGCLLLVEKVTAKDADLNRLFIKYYYDFKRRNHYSDLEISQKREALENVLIPYRPEENIELLTKCGYKAAEIFFRWYNFCGLVAIK